MERRDNPVCHFVTPLDGNMDMDIHRPAEVKRDHFMFSLPNTWMSFKFYVSFCHFLSLCFVFISHLHLSCRLFPQRGNAGKEELKLS